MEWTETMKLNDKEYVLKEEAEGKVSAPVEVEKFIRNGSIAEAKLHMDVTNVLAIGSVKLSGSWVRTRISLDYLQRIINGLKAVTPEKETIDLVFSDDRPVMIGTLRIAEKEFVGFMLAPRVDSD